jgi:hypothetical protein
MRKSLTVLVLVFALACGVGALLAGPAEAAICTYMCACNGTVLKCCSGVCVPATGPTPIQCPQVNNC